MLNRDHRDVFAGLALALTGGSAALYAASHYSIGTVSRMGPGMIPVSLGLTLALFGVMIAVPAFSRTGSAVHIPWRPLIVVSISILCFALMIETLGLIPAVFSTVVISTFAERRIPLGRAVLLGAAMSSMTWAIFILGLSLPISSFDWPF